MNAILVKLMTRHVCQTGQYPYVFGSCEMDVSLEILDVSESQGAFVSCDMSTFINIWW